MTTPLHDALARRIDEIGSAQVDVSALVDRGERRLRRRRVSVVLASAAAVAVAIAVTVGGSVLEGSTTRDLGPADNHQHDGQKSDGAPQERQHVTRPIVYSDDTAARCGSDSFGCIGLLHMGDREVRIDQPYSSRGWTLQVTDAGVVYGQADRSVWFTDGGAPRQIAEHLCSDALNGSIATGNAGPRAVWVDCSPGKKGTLVVFDTDTGREVARHLIPGCQGRRAFECWPDALLGEVVYVGSLHNPPHDSPVAYRRYRVDLSTGQVELASPRVEAGDFLAQPRGLMMGDSRQSARPEEGIHFDVRGSRLVATDPQPGPEPRPTRVFDLTTGRPVHFHLVGEYRPTPMPDYFVGITPTGRSKTFALFEWIDDDTVALAQVNEDTAGDIITCHLSDGACSLAVPGPRSDRVFRMVP